MSNMLTLFGFKGRNPNLNSSLENVDEGNYEKNEKRGRRPSERAIKIKEEITSAKSTPKIRKYNTSKTDFNDSSSKKIKKYSRRLSVKTETRESDDEDEFDENGDIRRSKRGRKPKKTYSPEKVEEKKKRGKRKLLVDSVEQKPMKREKMENTKRNSSDGETNRESEETSASSDSSELSNSEYEESEEEGEAEEVEKSSSSSSADDSEDEYQPSSVVSKKNIGRGRKRRSGLSAGMNTPNTTCESLNDTEVLEKIKNGEIPETFLYRSDSNTIFIPKLRPGMIGGNGKDISVQSTSSDFFKYVRVRQKTKQDHADPEKVRKLIQAVRRTPILWDQRLSCHQDKSLVRRAWLKIDEELGEDPEYSLNRRRQIWKNKKDYYVNIVQTDLGNQWMFTRDFDFYEPMVNFRAANITFKSLHAKTIYSPFGGTNLTCGSKDDAHLMNFMLKSIHDCGMADEKMMSLHQNSIKTIFESNFEQISTKFTQKKTD